MSNFNANIFVVDGDTSTLQTVSLKDLLQATNAYGVFGSETKRGTRLMLADKDGNRLTINGKNSSAIRIAEKAILPANGDLFDEDNTPWLKELFNKNLIYHGTSTIKEEGKADRVQPWLAISAPGSFKNSKVVTVSDLMAVTAGGA